MSDDVDVMRVRTRAACARILQPKRVEHANAAHSRWVIPSSQVDAVWREVSGGRWDPRDYMGDDPAARAVGDVIHEASVLLLEAIDR